MLGLLRCSPILPVLGCLMGLADGRALPATVLAAEAGVSPQAMSSHLSKLTAAGLVTVERSGRYRYYSLAGLHVGEVLEALASVARPRRITSLREGTRARRLRVARTCYDHLAGQLGVRITQGLIDEAALVRVDGVSDASRRVGDRLSAPVTRHPYRLGDEAGAVLKRLGIDLGDAADRSRRSRRPMLRFCLDWTEQQHHLSGVLGAILMSAFLEAGWIIHLQRPREIGLTRDGAGMLRDCLGVIDPPGLRPGLP